MALRFTHQDPPPAQTPYRPHRRGNARTRSTGAETVNEGNWADVNCRPSARAAPTLLACKVCTMTRREIRNTMPSTTPSRCMKYHSRFDPDSFNLRTGRCGRKWLLKCAADSNMRLVMKEGHVPGPLQEKASR